MLLSRYALGRACTPTRFYFLSTSLATYSLSFFSYVSFLWFIFSFLIFIYNPSRLEPVCFFLGTHCGGRRCALPPAPPHPLLFFNRLPLLPTLFFSTQWVRKALLSKLALTETKHQVCGDSLISSEDPSRSMVGEISLKYSTQLRNLNSPPGKGSKATCSIASWLSAKALRPEHPNGSLFLSPLQHTLQSFGPQVAWDLVLPRSFFVHCLWHFCDAIRSKSWSHPVYKIEISAGPW